MTDPALSWEAFYGRLRRELDSETAEFVVATIGEHRPESATPADLIRSARTFAARRGEQGRGDVAGGDS